MSPGSDRTTFDQAGASLIEEQDRKRMEEMGDFDANPAYQSDSIEKMRAAIKAKTAQLGLEKSKVSAAYIEARQERAQQAGPPGQNTDPDTFAGLDLSKISTVKTGSSGAPQSQKSQWNEELPSMFYDPEDELTIEEQEEVDPIMKLGALEQGLNELKNAQWPNPGAALREVFLMLGVVALSAVLIIGWDKILRELYTTIGFIPTKEDIANYASRFDGLDLPQGWTNNMNDQDVSQFAGAVQGATSGAGSAAAAPAASSLLPDL